MWDTTYFQLNPIGLQKLNQTTPIGAVLLIFGVELGLRQNQVT